jgi:hypothetical protein
VRIALAAAVLALALPAAADAKGLLDVSCGEELTDPEDVPENWVHSTQCGDTLTAGPGSLTATTRAGNLILSSSGPQ